MFLPKSDTTSIKNFRDVKSGLQLQSEHVFRVGWRVSVALGMAADTGPVSVLLHHCMRSRLLRPVMSAGDSTGVVYSYHHFSRSIRRPIGVQRMSRISSVFMVSPVEWERALEESCRRFHGPCPAGTSFFLAQTSHSCMRVTE